MLVGTTTLIANAESRMLEAIIHSKVCGRLRELVYDGGKAQGSLHRDLHEDVITSTVFGPLQYMTTEQCWRNVRHVLLGGKSEHPAGFNLGAFKPDTHKLEFWPLKMGVETRVEPDLVIQFDENANKRSLVVLLEVKWGAELSSDQLRMQKLATIKRYEKARDTRDTRDTEIAQVFLARAVHTEVARKQIEDTQCHAVTWSQIATWTQSNSASNIWAKHVDQLLNQLGIVPFTEFIRPGHEMSEAETEAVLAWTINPWRFDGFNSSLDIDNESLAIVNQWRIAQ